MNAVKAAGKVLDAVGNVAGAVADEAPKVISNVLKAASNASEAMEQYTASLPITTYRSVYNDIVATYGMDVANEYLTRIGKPIPQPQQQTLTL